MPISASELRQNIYRLLDEVLETGTPLEVERRGRRLRIVAEEGPSKLERIRGHGNPDVIVGDPEDLAAVGWSWDPDRTLEP